MAGIPYNRTFIFYRGDNTNRLEVWHSYGVLGSCEYPMTLTIRECVEDWCEDHRHYLVDFKVSPYAEYEQHNMGSGSFKFVRLRNE